MIRPSYEKESTAFLADATCVFFTTQSDWRKGNTWWFEQQDLCRLLGDRGPFAVCKKPLTKEQVNSHPKAVYSKHPMLYAGQAIPVGAIFLLEDRPEDRALQAAGLVHRVRAPH